MSRGSDVERHLPSSMSRQYGAFFTQPAHVIAMTVHARRCSAFRIIALRSSKTVRDRSVGADVRLAVHGADPKTHTSTKKSTERESQ